MRGKRLKIDLYKLVWGFFFILFIVFVAMLIYFPTYSRYVNLKRENLQMKEKIAQLKIQIKELEKQGEDAYLLEKMARENLGAVKEDEIVIDIIE